MGAFRGYLSVLDLAKCPTNCVILQGKVATSTRTNGKI